MSSSGWFESKRILATRASIERRCAVEKTRVTSCAPVAALILMPEGESNKVFTLANVDPKSLGETAKLFVEKMGDAIGGIARPWQTRRVAKAEADAVVIAEEAKIRVTDLQRRAAARWLEEEAKKQANMEAIAAAAVPLISEGQAKPDQIERDWLTNFFEKSRLTSDQEMQQLWAKILAGEANAPGKFGKRTVDLLASLDKNDAEQFQNLCRFNWSGFGLHGTAPVLFDLLLPFYVAHGLTSARVMRLCEVGLAAYDYSVWFTNPLNVGGEVKWYGPVARVEYAGCHYALYPPQGCRLAGRRVSLTQAGVELASLCPAASVEGFVRLAIDTWKADGVMVLPMRFGEAVPDRLPVGEV